LTPNFPTAEVGFGRELIVEFIVCVTVLWKLVIVEDKVEMNDVVLGSV